MTHIGDPNAAAQAIRDGKTIILTVGTNEDDPVLRVWREDGGVMSHAIAGWSAGVTEPVCAIDSPFLLTYLSNRHTLVIEGS